MTGYDRVETLLEEYESRQIDRLGRVADERLTRWRARSSSAKAATGSARCPRRARRLPAHAVQESAAVTSRSGSLDGRETIPWPVRRPVAHVVSIREPTS